MSPRLAARLAVACLLVFLALSVPIHGQPRAIGDEFQVNVYTPHAQEDPAVAVLANGDFVVVWGDEDPYLGGIFARRFSSSGVGLGADFKVHSFTDGLQVSPAIAADGQGSFVVTWSSFGQDGSHLGIFARRYSSDGTALATEFQVNTYTDGEQSDSAVSADQDGGFVVAWNSLHDGSNFGIFARRFSAAGTPLAVEFQVNSYTTQTQYHPDVSVNSTGAFVIAWESRGQDGDQGSIFAQRFDSSGGALATEFQVNTSTVQTQKVPRVALADNGSFVIAWHAFLGSETVADAFARRFDAGGSPLGPEFLVSSYTPVGQSYPTIAMDGQGDFVIAWQGEDAERTGYFISARAFAANGAPRGNDFQVNSSTALTLLYPAIAMSPSGDFVVAWQDTADDPGSLDIYARRFEELAVLDVDGDGTVAALTDGLLVLRYLFGFRGNVLISGVVGAGCSRCDTAEIEAYLATVN